MTTTLTQPAPDTSRRSGFAVAGVAAVLAVAVTAVHIEDQGGLLALKDPAYIGQSWRVLEVAGLVAAALLLLNRHRASSWLLAAGVAGGPLVGFIVTRSVGLPGFHEDIGNWTEPIGLASIVVEGALLALSALMLARVSAAGRWLS